MTNEIKRIKLLAMCAALGLSVIACGNDDDDDDVDLDGGITDGGANAGDAGDAGDGEDAGTQPLGKNNRPELGEQIDRVGRAAVTTATVGTFNPNMAERGELRDEYNAASDPAMWVSEFTSDIESSLAILDGLDGVCGNQLLAGSGEDRYAALAGTLANDQLYVNTASATCGTYLGLEAEFVGALPAGGGGCGGRTPNDDVIERSYSVLAAGRLSGIDDTIDEDDADHDPSEFPFLAEPTN